MRRLRAAANGVLVALALVAVLPAIAVAERVRAGAGRRVAIAGTRAVARACGIRFQVAGGEGLDAARSYVYVPNHTSPIDIPAMLIARPGCRFLAAAELFRVPLLGGALRALDSVPVDRAKPASASRSFRGRNEQDGPLALVVFAEGGIPADRERRRFKTGAFVLAIDSGAAVVPVSITGGDVVLPRGSRFFARPGTVGVLLHEPISTKGLGIADRKAVRDRTEQTVRDALG